MFTDKKMGFSTTEQQQHLELDHFMGYCTASYRYPEKMGGASTKANERTALNSVVGKKDSPEKLSVACERVVEFTEQRAPNPARGCPGVHS